MVKSQLLKGNMETKLFEIRDEGTFIPAIAIAVSRADGPLARAAGYGAQCIILGALHSKDYFTYNPYDWTRSRTMHVAHNYIIEQWDKLVSGDLVDVQFILKEKTEPAQSELEAY